MESNSSNLTVYQHIREVKESSNLKEVTQLLSTGKWIAINATPNEPPVFVLGRIL